MKRPSKVLSGIVAVAVASALTALPAKASDIQPFTTVFATDVAYAGLGGMREGGTGTITVAGVTGTVTQAFLFWHGPTRNADPASNATVLFGGTGVTGTNIGTSDDNCWGYTNSQAYRADITPLVTGNGDYALAEFVKDGGNINVNGAGMVVFFDDGNVANNRDVVMFNGNDSNQANEFDADGWNVTLAGINYATGTATMDLMVSDGQPFTDGSLQLNGAPLDAGPLLFQGDSVPSAGASPGSLWDQRAFEVTTFLTPGSNNLALTHTYLNDCLSLILAAVNLPAGAAPNQPTTTTTTTSTTTTTAPTTTTTTSAPTTTTTRPPAARPVAAVPQFTG